ncbi:MAG: dephospho-CoA kinase, partial [Lachnospiraceae bacterium]
DFVDEMWFIYASSEVRRRRLKESRGYDDDKINRIMASQLSDDAFRKSSDFVIDNSNTLEEAYSRIKQRLEAYTWQE